MCGKKQWKKLLSPKKRDRADRRESFHEYGNDKDNTNRVQAVPNKTKQKNLYFIILSWRDTALLCWKAGKRGWRLRDRAPAVLSAGCERWPSTGVVAICVQRNKPEGTIRGVTAGHGKRWLPLCLYPRALQSSAWSASLTKPYDNHN